MYCTLLSICRFDEVIAGAPFFSEPGVPDVGRVYVYENNNVRLQYLCLFENTPQSLFTVRCKEKFAKSSGSLGNTSHSTYVAAVG